MNRRGFTLVELLVVIAMIAIIAGAFSVSVSSAMERARIQKATGEVKSLTQALLAHENRVKTLEEMEREEVTSGTFGYLMGGAKGSGDETSDTRPPVLVQASLDGDGRMLDPWGHPYLVTIRKGDVSTPPLIRGLQTGYYLPNYNRLLKKERQ